MYYPWYLESLLTLHACMFVCFYVCLWDSLSRTHCIARLASNFLSAGVAALLVFLNFVLQLHFSSAKPFNAFYVKEMLFFFPSLTWTFTQNSHCCVKHTWHKDRKTMGKVPCTLVSLKLPQRNSPKSRDEQMHSPLGFRNSNCLPYIRNSSIWLVHNSE